MQGGLPVFQTARHTDQGLSCLPLVIDIFGVSVPLRKCLPVLRRDLTTIPETSSLPFLLPERTPVPPFLPQRRIHTMFSHSIESSAPTHQKNPKEHGQFPRRSHSPFHLPASIHI